jgi:hypothetical protein
MNKASINVTLIDKTYLFTGKKGKYLNIVLWENRDGPDQYGNTHYITQDVGKEAREKGIKGPIIGNAKMEGASAAPRGRPAHGGAAPPSKPAAAPTAEPKVDDDDVF